MQAKQEIGVRIAIDLDEWFYTVCLSSEDSIELSPSKTFAIPGPSTINHLIRGDLELSLKRHGERVSLPSEHFEMQDKEIMASATHTSDSFI